MKIRDLFKTKNELKSHDRIENVDSFWVQNINLTKIDNRLPYFERLCLNKKVIHFGCTDWPIFNPENNLHIKLSRIAKILHGFDIDNEGIENLKKYVNQEYFSNFNEVAGLTYDICLVPETIEHVDNVRTFLEGLSKIDAKKFLITGPNCFAPVHMKRNINKENLFQELIHPDHNCWYSPYTLKNQIEKYSKLKVTNVVLMEEERMICCEAEHV
jgi:hypothetical protein